MKTGDGIDAQDNPGLVSRNRAVGRIRGGIAVMAPTSDRFDVIHLSIHTFLYIALLYAWTVEQVHGDPPTISGRSSFQRQPRKWMEPWSSRLRSGISG